MSDRLQLDGVDLVFDDPFAKSMDLILVPCPVCDCGWRSDECRECEDSGWILTPGAPIDLADLERMAPWADAPTGRPLESGEIEALQRECFRIALGPGMG